MSITVHYMSVNGDKVNLIVNEHAQLNI